MQAPLFALGLSIVLLCSLVSGIRTISTGSSPNVGLIAEDELDDVYFEPISHVQLEPASHGHWRSANRASPLPREQGSHELRLHARGDTSLASRRPTPVIVRFDTGQKTFILGLREQPNIIVDEARVRIHQESLKSVVSQPVPGSTFVSDKLVVLDRSDVERKFSGNATSLYHLSSQPGIEVVENPFGRFYVEQGSVMIGGFVHDGHYYRINNGTHPLTRLAALKFASDHDEKDRAIPPNLLISRHDLGEAALGSNSTRRYRCGNDVYGSQKSPAHAPSFFAQLLRHPREDTNTNTTTNTDTDKLHGSPKKLEAKIKDDESTTGCPLSPKVLYVGVVADCSYMEAFKLDATQARANIINDFNTVSAIYEEHFNIHLGILSIDLLMDCSSTGSSAEFNKPCTPKSRMDQRLSQFSKWRKGQPQEAGLYHLVTGCSDADVVGIGWLNQVCQVKPYENSNGEYVGGTSVSAFIKNQFAVIAHEIGHNFGAVHDCDQEACQKCSGPADCQCCTCDQCDCKGRFLMSPESGGLNVKQFSPCAQKDICKKMPVIAPCLKEPGTLKTITKAMCGDGIKDEGEECDCGGPEKCKNHPCCTVNCKLKPHAKCSDGNDRCCKNCEIIPASKGHVCIPSKGPCQKASVCDGVSADCPKVEYIPDGMECGLKGSGDRCASGQCTSRSKQCAAVGARLGLLEECPYEFGSCGIVCKRGKECVILDALYIDGTPCGYSGKCYGGQCSEPALQTFLMRNVVPLGIFGGAILFFLTALLVNTIIAACRARTRNNLPSTPQHSFE